MCSGPSLSIGGFVPLSTVDKPGELTATVFTRGCPWRCPYCHNAHLQEAGPQSARSGELQTWESVMAFLDTRRGLLDGVTFSGGEPTIHRGLGAAMREARSADFSCYLHTSGALPHALEHVLPLLDWVGFDVKAPFSEYHRITSAPDSGARARESLRLLAASGVPFEVRTTVDSRLLDTAALERLAGDLASEGVTSWVLQECRIPGAAPVMQPDPLGPGVVDSLTKLIGSVSVRPRN